MEIQSSRLSMAASHAYGETRSVQLRAERPAPDAAAIGAPRATVPSISATALAASRAGGATAAAFSRASVEAGATAAGREDTASSLVSAEFALLEELVFLLTGQRVRVFDASALERVEAPPTLRDPNAAARAAAGGDPPRFIATESIAEAEASSFVAEGEILTADGERIHFQVSLSMSRSFSMVREFRADGAGKPVDPLVVNFAGTAAELRDACFQFDLDADGTPESIATLAPGRAYLVFDRNGNGRIDDGSELFGPVSGDGFAELAALDRDRNGWIDASDPDFARLSVWTPDAQGNGAPLPSACVAGWPWPSGRSPRPARP